MREFKSPDIFVHHYDPMESCGNPRKLWQFCSAENSSEIHTASCFTIAYTVRFYARVGTLKNNYTDARTSSVYHSVHSEIPGNTYLAKQSREHVRYIDFRRIFAGGESSGYLPQARCCTLAIRRRFIPGTLCAVRRRIPRAPFSRNRVGKRARASLRVAVSAQYAETVHTNVG